VNRHQQTALRHYCLLGGETLYPRFRYVQGLASIVLTVNAGYE
jgi:hypothetical protein